MPTGAPTAMNDAYAAMMQQMQGRMPTQSQSLAAQQMPTQSQSLAAQQLPNFAPLGTLQSASGQFNQQLPTQSQSQAAMAQQTPGQQTQWGR